MLRPPRGREGGNVSMMQTLESTAAVVQGVRRRLGIRGVVLRVALIIGLGELGFATVIPLLPLYLTDQLGASAGLVGVVVAAFALVETVGKTLWGSVADRIGRRPMIVAGLLISSIAPLIMSVLRIPLLFVPLRLVDGAGSSALWPAASAIVADKSSIDRRATAMGALNTFFLAGLALGPALGLFVSGLTKSFTAGFYVASLLLAGAGVLAATILPGIGPAHLPPSERGTDGFKGIARSSRLGEMVESIRFSPHLLTMLMVAFVQAFGLGVLSPIIVIYVRHTLGIPEHLIGSLILVFVLAIALTLVPAGRLADRWGKVKTVAWGMVVGCVGMWVLPISTRLEVFTVGALLLGISYALTTPAWHALVSEFAPPGRIGLAMGAAQTAEGLGLVLGALLSGVLWDSLGHLAPFIVSASFLSVATAVLLMALRPLARGSTVP